MVKDEGDVSGQGGGYYWSSSPDGRYGAYNLRFNSSGQGMLTDDRGYGFSVRAVLAE